jgi:ankyrin repeat protein
MEKKNKLEHIPSKNSYSTAFSIVLYYTLVILCISNRSQLLCMEADINTADINTKDDFGNTMLHYAAKQNNPEIARHLLALGARPDIKDPDGKNPLEIATAVCSQNVIDMLSQASQNSTPEIQNWIDHCDDHDSQRTLYQQAIQAQNYEILRLLYQLRNLQVALHGKGKSEADISKLTESSFDSPGKSILEKDIFGSIDDSRRIDDIFDNVPLFKIFISRDPSDDEVLPNEITNFIKLMNQNNNS